RPRKRPSRLITRQPPTHAVGRPAAAAGSAAPPPTAPVQYASPAASMPRPSACIPSVSTALAGTSSVELAGRTSPKMPHITHHLGRKYGTGSGLAQPVVEET